MQSFIKKIDIITIINKTLFALFMFFINFFLVNYSILDKIVNNGSKIAENIRILSFVLYIISVLAVSLYTSRILSRKFLLKLGIGYGIYAVTSYAIVVTRNLNNEGFKLFDLINNNFIQFNFLLTVLGMILIVYGFKYLMKLPYFNRYFRIEALDKVGNIYPLCLFLASFAANDFLLIDYILERNQVVITNNINSTAFQQYLLHSGGSIVITLTAFGVLSFIYFKGMSDARHNQASFSLVILTSSILSLIFNYTLQYGVKGDDRLLERYIFPGATLFQILSLFIVFILIYLSINRYLLPTFLIISLGIILSLANGIKQGMRSEPLLVTDFVWLQEPKLILSFVSKSAIILCISFLVTITVVYYLLRKRILVEKLVVKKRFRYSMISFLLIVSLSVFVVFKNEKNGKITEGIPVLSTVNNWEDITWMGFSVNARYKSLMYVWIKQLSKTLMEKPDDYSKDRISEIAKKYERRALEINKDRFEDIHDQTIIYVLSESFANPNRLPEVHLSENVIPNIESIKEKNTGGLMISNGYGGGTANMEFQTLTGLPFDNYSSATSVLYTEAVPNMKVFPTISNHFDSKNRIVIHPSGANNYNRKNIYKQLGFNKLIFSSDSNRQLQNVQYEGVSVSDETVYNNVLSNLNASESQFFSVITMQNHAPWSDPQPENVTATGDGLNDEENENLTSYARLLTHTDKSTMEFLEKLKNIDKKITVVFYGDHLPGLYPPSIFANNPSLQYETDYFIWSNFQEKKINYNFVGASDFIAELFEHTNSKVSPYYALLTDVLSTKSTSENKELTDEQAIAQEELRLIQYDISLGNAYIKKHKKFFKIGEEK